VVRVHDVQRPSQARRVVKRRFFVLQFEIRAPFILILKTRALASLRAAAVGALGAAATVFARGR
jgi:hypothetical protein